MIFGIDPWLFCLLGLASFRLTRLIVYDKITEFLRAPFFEEVEEIGIKGEKEIFIVPKQKGIKKWLGELLSCYWCTGIWSSLFLLWLYFFYPMIAEPIIILLAVSALAAIIETIISRILGN
jgi:hypothetical protein